jgi:hypothetical protein
MREPLCRARPTTTFVGEKDFGGKKEKAKVCYTRFALSDLEVSSGLPFIPASLLGTDFPPSPYSVYPSVSHPEISHWTETIVCREGSSIAVRLDWHGRFGSDESGE